MSRKTNRRVRSAIAADVAAEVRSAADTHQSPSANRLAAFQQYWWAVGIVLLLTLGATGAGMKYLQASARQEQAANIGVSNFEKTAPSLLSKVNPFVEAPPPAPTPQLSKEYIYAGSRMLAVEDANANAAPPADLAVWRPSSGYWYVLGGQGSQQTFAPWGQNGDQTVPGDYDGDGKTDFSVFRKSGNQGGSGTWYISYSSNGSYSGITFGLDDDKVAAADYDGDGKTDIAVYRPSTGYWYIQRSSDQGLSATQFGGVSGDAVTPADFDGDGKADLAFWRESTTTFYILASGSGNQLQTIVYGAAGDVPVVADYDGDGRADAAIRRGSQWYLRSSQTGQTSVVNWGQAADRAVANDYDGDGKVDVAVWRNADGHWLIRQSASLSVNGGLRDVGWGQAGDYPVPEFYRR